MEKGTVLYFNRAIQMLISKEEFELIKNDLSTVPIEHRKAFWNLILAGFSTKLAFINCKNLYEFVRVNNVDYMNILAMLQFINTKPKIGIYSKEIDLFAAN
ncbi:MAG: hypothetical protein HN778_16730 [Prolixibacteraceae bacterium]|jgi:hypothetical protein|nr:hypothetical protein [Prolixibacteraceae bacterium]MBT6005787.1 hypothetical protein [Prolixibacteraceae bacterium]MBT6766845.1 hypothetical protein [Prolixibacteraceae bacterium]MBT6998280.1 hypothetical protein [Prolixibacteraceae bacterium]MBT7396474.1 hypothetical protein [Prolixibacteraceae bacterium]